MRRLQHVSIDENRKHAQRLVVLDEPHAAHVGGEVKNLESALGGALAVCPLIQVERKILDIPENLVPLVERFNVNRAKLGITLPAQVSNEGAADEPAGAGNHHQFIFHLNATSPETRAGTTCGLSMGLKPTLTKSGMAWQGCTRAPGAG